MGQAAHASSRDPLTGRALAPAWAGRPSPGRPGAERLDPEALVAAARAGDRAAFEELVRSTYADTYALAFRMTGDEEDARDVLQEAYLRAYRGLRRFRGDAAFSTWLYRITANCASTHVTRRGRTRTAQLEPDAAVPDDRPEHDPEARASVSDETKRVAAAVADLPPRLRAVVVLRDIYDLPHEAIAAELGISETAAKVRLHRARKRLRERLFPHRRDGADEDGEG